MSNKKDSSVPTEQLLDKTDTLAQSIRSMYLPEKSQGNQSIISASGHPKYRRMMDKYFSRRGDMSRFIICAIDNYITMSGSELKEDGTLINSNQLVADL